MPKPVRHSLTAMELIELAALLRRAFDCISQLKATNPAAAPIQYPKLPSIFSESLVLLCGPVLFPGAKNLRRGRASADKAEERFGFSGHAGWRHGWDGLLSSDRGADAT
jgi:hypothetical protein